MAPKTIVLTGASRGGQASVNKRASLPDHSSVGIGLAIAEFLLKEPEQHNLVILSRSRDALEKVKAKSPKQVEILAGDLSDFSYAQRAVELAISSFGQLDGLIVNHGILGDCNRIADSDLSAFQNVFDVNFFSTVAFIKAAIPQLRTSKGRIILTSSGAAVSGYSSWGAYGSSKAAMNHLALTMKNEEPNIITLAVRPGVVNTEMQRELREVHLERLDESERKKFANAHKDGTLLEPSQPGNVIARLSIHGTKDLSGKFLSWNDETLKAFQD